MTTLTTGNWTRHFVSLLDSNRVSLQMPIIYPRHITTKGFMEVTTNYIRICRKDSLFSNNIPPSSQKLPRDFANFLPALYLKGGSILGSRQSTVCSPSPMLFLHSPWLPHPMSWPTRERIWVSWRDCSACARPIPLFCAYNLSRAFGVALRPPKAPSNTQKIRSCRLWLTAAGPVSCAVSSGRFCVGALSSVPNVIDAKKSSFFYFLSEIYRKSPI